MDSKQLFRFYHSKFYLSNWLNEEGELAQSEEDVKWHYCEDEVYLCISANKSSLILKSTVANEIVKILHKKELGIMNESLTKIMQFTSIGVYKIGLICDFPKNRVPPEHHQLKVSFHANRTQSEYSRKIAIAINKHFKNLEIELNKDYGGSMEHLWIDLQLIESDQTFPFRFQKRTNIPASFTELYSYNVGHYTVRPCFEKLETLSSEEEICSYVFELLYKSTQILEVNQKKLYGFNTTTFRLDFLSACIKLGYILA